MVKMVLTTLVGMTVVYGAVAGAADNNDAGRISLSVTDGNVHDVLSMIAQQAGLNLTVDQRVQGNVTVSLHDLTAEAALEVVAKAAGARVRREGDVYIVEPVPPPATREQASITGHGGVMLPPARTEGDIPTLGSDDATVTLSDGKVIRIIKLKYADPAMMAQLFGGNLVGGALFTYGSPFHHRSGGPYTGYGGYGAGYDDYRSYGGREWHQGGRYGEYGGGYGSRLGLRGGY
ncbi:MAG: hypothetical protein ACUVX8_14920 [Candidatus Zipacnadales bacterium]